MCNSSLINALGHAFNDIVMRASIGHTSSSVHGKEYEMHQENATQALHLYGEHCLVKITTFPSVFQKVSFGISIDITISQFWSIFPCKRWLRDFYVRCARATGRVMLILTP